MESINNHINTNTTNTTSSNKSGSLSHTDSETSFKAKDTEYRLLKVIGKGTYSTVYLCEHLKDHTTAADEEDDVVSHISDFVLHTEQINLNDDKKSISANVNLHALKTI